MISVFDLLKKGYLSSSSDETLSLGRHIGQHLTAPSVLCLFGDLGAGKTTLVQGICEGATADPFITVQSPTFNYLNIYEGQKTVYHFDLYRLDSIEQFLSMGFDEYFDADGLCCIEWSEKIASYLPENAIKIHLSCKNRNERLITLIGN